jgi:hypothetical protein
MEDLTQQIEKLTIEKLTIEEIEELSIEELTTLLNKLCVLLNKLRVAQTSYIAMAQTQENIEKVSHQRELLYKEEREREN